MPARARMLACSCAALPALPPPPPLPEPPPRSMPPPAPPLPMQPLPLLPLPPLCRRPTRPPPSHPLARHLRRCPRSHTSAHTSAPLPHCHERSRHRRSEAALSPPAWPRRLPPSPLVLLWTPPPSQALMPPSGPSADRAAAASVSARNPDYALRWAPCRSRTWPLRRAAPDALPPTGASCHHSPHLPRLLALLAGCRSRTAGATPPPAASHMTLLGRSRPRALRRDNAAIHAHSLAMMMASRMRIFVTTPLPVHGTPDATAGAQTAINSTYRTISSLVSLFSLASLCHSI